MSFPTYGFLLVSKKKLDLWCVLTYTMSSCVSLTGSLEHKPPKFACLCIHTFSFSFSCSPPYYLVSPLFSFYSDSHGLLWDVQVAEWLFQSSQAIRGLLRVDTTDSWESTGQPVIIFLFVWSFISPTDLHFSRTQLLFTPFCFYWSWLVWS